MLPHAGVHRRGNHDRPVVRKVRGGQKIVAEAGGHAGDRIGRGRCDDHDVGSASQIEVSVVRAPNVAEQFGADVIARQRGERRSADEVRCSPGHDYVDVVPGALERTQRIDCLVGGDAAAHTEQHACHQRSLGGVPVTSEMMSTSIAVARATSSLTT